MNPDRLLAVLIGTAIGGGGIIQGLYWKNTSASGSGGAERERISELESEIEMLSILLNHLVTAIDNTRLIQDKIEMERRMFARILGSFLSFLKNGI